MANFVSRPGTGDEVDEQVHTLSVCTTRNVELYTVGCGISGTCYQDTSCVAVYKRKT